MVAFEFDWEGKDRTTQFDDVVRCLESFVLLKHTPIDIEGIGEGYTDRSLGRTRDLEALSHLKTKAKYKKMVARIAEKIV